MNKEIAEKKNSRDFRAISVILLLASVASIIYLISLKIAYPLFQGTRLADPLAEIHSLFPLYYSSICIVAISILTCLAFRIQNRAVHIVLLLLLALMLWGTPYYLAEYVRPPDGPKNIGIALQVPQVMQGGQFNQTIQYAVGYPLYHVLDYTLLNATGMDYILHLHLFPLIYIGLFVFFCYAFLTKLFNPLTSLFAMLLTIIGLHYIVFHPSPHVVGMLLLVVALILLWRRDTTSNILAFLLIIATIVAHPVSPLVLGVFVAAYLIISLLTRQSIRYKLVIAAMLAVCMLGWFIWPMLPLVPVEAGPAEAIAPAEATAPAEALPEPGRTDVFPADIQKHIFPRELETTGSYLLGTPFVYKNIYNLNKTIYFLYAFLVFVVLSLVFYQSTGLKLKKFKDFYSEPGGLSKAEFFMFISIPVLLLLTILLGERGHVLIERGLSFTILAISSLIASVVIKMYNRYNSIARKFISITVAAFVLLFTVAFPIVAYSIDAYTSFPISEEAGLKFLAKYMPLKEKTLATWAWWQLNLYELERTEAIPIWRGKSLNKTDILAFRRSSYYYASMRQDLSFEDNWFVRYLDFVSTSNKFNSVYYNPTFSVYIRSNS